MSVDNERRSGGQRVAVKTLVEIGAGAGGSAAFEAESVDITTAGMHLKTAYLPETGEPLICRLEGNGKEIVVQGEVVWRNEDAYGGDFGVRFLEMDAESLATLRELLGEQPAKDDAQASPDENDAPKPSRNTRVRLHIEGLGSPMKARVREVTRSEVLVGSNLEFLKVGRSVDLENIDSVDNRPARIERVNIEIDPASHVPQLMVALRYLDAQEDVADAGRADAASRRSRGEEDDMSEQYDAGAESDDARDDELDEEVPQGRSAMLWSKVKDVGPKLAVLGDKAKEIGGRAKDVVSRAIDRARAKKASGEDAAPRPRRTTAPPPNGALRGDGTRMARDAMDDDLNEIAAPDKKKVSKRAAAAGVAVLMIALVAVAFVHRRNAATAATDPAAEAASSGAVAAAEASSNGAAPAAPTEGAMVANVPLFGPTPMTTGAAAAAPTAAPSAAVAVAAFPAAVAVPPPSDAKPAGDDASADELEDQGSGSAAVADNNAGGSDEEADEASDEGSSKPSARAEHGQHGSHSGSGKASAGSFGRGKVRNATVLALRMKQGIKSIRGTGNANGFTVEVGGTRAKEAAAGLARQDRRIASAKVTNKGSDANLVVQFREPVAAYRVVAQGSTLRIMIGNEKKTAETTKSEPRTHKPAAHKKKAAKKSAGKH